MGCYCDEHAQDRRHRSLTDGREEQRQSFQDDRHDFGVGDAGVGRGKYMKKEVDIVHVEVEVVHIPCKNCEQ